MTQKNDAPAERVIDGVPCVRLDSPLERWPGHIYLPRALTTDQFATWWEKYQENGGDGRDSVDEVTAVQRMYEERGHMVMDHSFGVEIGQFVALKNFIVKATTPLILEARNLPNLPGWWSGFLSGNKNTTEEEE